jgi:hypothetical protein
MRAILDAPEQLTIVRTDSMVIMTTGDGRTTRLALDGSKIGDDSTGIERKSRAEGDRVVSEISGMPMGKIAETYAVDPATGRLIVELQLAGRDGRTPDPQRRVYDRSR